MFSFNQVVSNITHTLDLLPFDFPVGGWLEALSQALLGRAAQAGAREVRSAAVILHCPSSLSPPPSTLHRCHGCCHTELLPSPTPHPPRV